MNTLASTRSEGSSSPSRIDRTFEELRRGGRKALIPFVTAGDPHPSLTVDLMHALVDGGANLIELGIPFSDPMADGPVIQRASARALAQGVGLARVLDFVEQFRRTDEVTPVVLMGYANPIERMGLDRFTLRAADVGVDGVLIVDCPPEEATQVLETLERQGISMIFLLAPTSTPARIARVAGIARGYVYYVSLAGVTGASHLDVDSLARALPSIRASLPVPVGVGFGIRDADSACAVARHCDGVVIGSRIIELIEHEPAARACDVARAFVGSIRMALDQSGGSST